MRTDLSLECLIYVSQSEIPIGRAESQVDDIVQWSTAFNSTVGITGALIFTGTHFAQLIEGEEAAISTLIASILRDPRHSSVNILFRGRETVRRFPDWSLAYNGKSQFVSRHVSEAFASTTGPKRLRTGGSLTDLLSEFARIRWMSVKTSS